MLVSPASFPLLIMLSNYPLYPLHIFAPVSYSYSSYPQSLIFLPFSCSILPSFRDYHSHPYRLSHAYFFINPQFAHFYPLSPHSLTLSLPLSFPLSLITSSFLTPILYPIVASPLSFKHLLIFSPLSSILSFISSPLSSIRILIS